MSRRHSPADKRLTLLDQLHIPYIVHGRSEGLDFAYPFLDIDNEGAFHEAARLLIQLGHNRIALANGEDWKTFAIHRERGVRKALNAGGLALPDHRLISNAMTDENGAVFDKFVTNPGCRLAESIAAFGREAPEVGFELHVASTADIDKGLLEGRFHVGIHPFHRASDSLSSVRLFVEPMFLCAAPQLPLLRSGRPDDDALRQAEFVGLGYHSPNMEQFWRLGLRPSARAFDQEASVLLIRSGRYIGFLPEHYARAFEAQGQLVCLHSENLRYCCEWFASVARSPRPGRIARRFMEILAVEHGAQAAPRC